jgi:hypothetical protein
MVLEMDLNNKQLVLTDLYAAPRCRFIAWIVSISACGMVTGCSPRPERQARHISQCLMIELAEATQAYFETGLKAARPWPTLWVAGNKVPCPGRMSLCASLCSVIIG